MNRSDLRRVFALALVGLAGLAVAHHSQSMFIETPVWITGTVIKYRPVDPHVMIELQEVQPDGPARKWIVEGPRRGRLEQILQNHGGIRDDQILKVGDRVTVCGFPLKKDFKPERMYADWPPEQGRFVHGQVMVMPGGNLQSWGPYGLIDNCVRGSDTTRFWISFLDRDPLAHQQWCDANRSMRMAHHTPREFIDEVNRRLQVSCQ